MKLVGCKLELFLMLRELGIREEGEERELHSGLSSTIFYDIEKLFTYPIWTILKTLEPFLWQVGKLRPSQLLGIPTGGQLLASFMGRELGVVRYPPSLASVGTQHIYSKPCVLIDDVLTTGGTIEKFLEYAKIDVDHCQAHKNEWPYNNSPSEWKPDYIAVLINRSDITEIEGIPIISGLIVDKVVR